MPSYHLNSDNGLPSDHVYSLMTDRYGYLWICTEKGVVKYNGYECRVFTTADGLPTDDIWGAVEDLSGKIWLAGISNEVGYIYNDKYYKAVLKDIKGTISPFSLLRYDSAVIFCSPYINGNHMNTICLARHDTVFPFALTQELLRMRKDEFQVFESPHIFIGSNNSVHLWTKNHMYELTNVKQLIKNPDAVRAKLLYHANSTFCENLRLNLNIVLDDHVMALYNGGVSKDVTIFNIAGNKESHLEVGTLGMRGNIEYVGLNNTIGEEKSLYAYTKSSILKFRYADKLIPAYSIDFDAILNTQNKKIIPISTITNNLWDTCIGTMRHGVFLKSKVPPFILLNEIDLDGYKYIGTVNDTITYWWNTDTKTLKEVCKQKIIREYIIDYTRLENAAIYNKDTIMLSGAFSHFLVTTTHKITDIAPQNFGGNVRKWHRLKNGNLFIFSKQGTCILAPPYNIMKTVMPADIDRYNDVVYDKQSDRIWGYNREKIFILGDENKKYIPVGNFANAGIDKIETVCIDDNYGNVFIKGFETAIIFDEKNNKCKSILRNLNLKRANMAVAGNKLVLYGDFGIAFYLITGKGSISEPIIYHNTRKIFYKKHQPVAVEKKRLLLNTDLGIYEIAIPADSCFDIGHSSNYTNYKLLVLYGHDVRNTTATDTVLIDQTNRTLTLDIINPHGSGQPTYYYKLGENEKWRKSVSGEIVLPDSYQPDNLYNISVYCADDAWESDIAALKVYVKPYWWQTRNARRWMWLGGGILAMAIIAIAVLVTRRLVLRAGQKKHLQRELELKAIYAQINPHFIFNSLTSAQMLISKNRMEDAYTHISKFSKLLRSYLKSSRNKYISIEDEVENLKNYLELQQTRFKDRFISEINVAPELNTSQIMIPSLIVQPFVENAINHGLLDSKRQGKLIIEFKGGKQPGKIYCIITDNGVGRQKARENKNATENTLGSYGNMMIKDLVRIFNQYENMQIDIRYEDREFPDTGTSVIISITNIPKSSTKKL